MCTRLPPPLTIYSYTCSGYILVATKSLIVPWPITWNFSKLPALRFRERERGREKKEETTKRRKNEKKEKETRFSRYVSRDREFTGDELHLRAWTFFRRIENANFRQPQFQRIREANTISVRPSRRKIGRRLVNDARKATKGIGASGRYWSAVRW